MDARVTKVGNGHFRITGTSIDVVLKIVDAVGYEVPRSRYDSRQHSKGWVCIDTTSGREALHPAHSGGYHRTVTLAVDYVTEFYLPLEVK